MSEPRIIYHMTPEGVWRAQAPNEPYRADTLATEGFIHCTADRNLLLQAANSFYRNRPDEYVILCICEEDITADVKWEAVDGNLFPHIYGPLNLDAVRRVIPFPRDGERRFAPPTW